MTPSEQARADTHQCDTCEGSGRVRGFENRDPKFRREYDRYSVLCPVCQGSGRISDRMPVQDAIADAETFMRVLGISFGLPGVQEAFGDAYHAQWCARMALQGGGSLTTEEYAGGAVRYAFKAVPGLRGDR